MANICNFIMKVKGQKDSLEQFIKLGATSTYIPDEQYLATTDFIDYSYSKDNVLTIHGECSWSVYSSMLYGMSKRDFEINSKKNVAVNLQSVCKILKLHIQVSSEELGVGINEFFEINETGIIKESIVDLEFIYPYEFFS